MRINSSEIVKFVENFNLDDLYSKLPATEREWRTAIWLKHPDERTADYKFFAEYYLPLPSVYRNVRLAFHLNIFLNPRVEGMTWADARTKAPRGDWYTISRGEAAFADSSRNIHPKKKIIPFTWKQRAAEFDKVKRRVVLDDMLKIRNRLIEGELSYSIDALDLFDKMFYKWREEMLSSGILYLLDDEEESSVLDRLSGGRATIDIKDIKHLRDITVVRDEISKYARRAMGLPSVIRDDIMDEGISDIEVEFVNSYGLASTTGNDKTINDDITTEQLLDELKKLKTVD